MRVIILSVYRFAQNALKRWFKSEMFTSYRISWPLNPFPLTHLRPEVELMYLLRMRIYYRHKSRRKWCRARNGRLFTGKHVR